VARNEDPRLRNRMFDASSMGSYLEDYAAGLRAALDGVDPAALESACLLLQQASSAGRRVYAIGNGGSAAIAEHLCCDWTKGTDHADHPVIDSLSMTSNVALYSAIANDFGFEEVFSRQLGFFGQVGDVLVAISSSGKSANIVAGVNAARAIGMTTIGLTGFDGGALRGMADISIHVDASNYGIIEDAHQAVMHVIAQYIAYHRDNAAEKRG
jgi:D-sedoheptulose 7-phosphate isomerase